MNHLTSDIRRREDVYCSMFTVSLVQDNKDIFSTPNSLNSFCGEKRYDVNFGLTENAFKAMRLIRCLYFKICSC